MTTPAITPEALPLCRALAVDPRRHHFARGVQMLLKSKSYETKLEAMLRLQGMVDAYFEAGVVQSDQYQPLCSELADFVWGQA